MNRRTIMQRSIRGISAVSALAIGAVSHAAGSYSGTVSSVQGYGESYSAVFVGLSGTITGTPPSCATQNTRFVISPSTPAGTALLAIVLSAVARGVPVTITGSATCELWGDTESILFLASN